MHFVLHLRSQQSLARGSLPRQPRILETLHPLSLLTAFCCHRLVPAEHYTVVSILILHKFRLSEKLHKHQNFLHTLIYSPERVAVSLAFSLGLEDHLGFSQRSAHLCIQATPQSLLGPQARESPGLVRSLVWSWALVSVAWRGGWQPPHCDTDLRWKVPSCAQTFLCTWHLWGSWGAPRSPSSHLQVHLPPSPESFLHLLSHVQQFTLCAGGCSLFLSSGSSA